MTAPSGKVDWKAIRRDLLGRIQSGAWKPGDQIPREVELAAHYDCTRSTVGRALRDLATAGFLDRKRKGGTTVSANPVRKAPLDVPIIAEAIRKAGHVAGYHMLDAGVRPASPAIAAEMGVPAGTSFLFVSALHLADDRPYQVEQRWLLPATVVGLTPEILETMPADEWLLRNVPLTRAHIAIEAAHPPAEVADALKIAPDMPTLLITRTSWRQTRLIGMLRLYHVPGHRLLTGI
ncbi:GntR family transcriptional regulator [Roseinatronobacter alkalisoli]|uniref:GntR family transcriptional regulator n=1 Tax=Roseinatronobacter alkalisoli TaxID=3028235 RepID=A0ABT5T6Z2_9RHOB|nr:GntR family transcriptional regulator [Roseinatronobacter sp. HJB301]MDD7970882.1 GntR family transcriptional regulator [Roseinatronobacter sp. HJB301]